MAASSKCSDRPLACTARAGEVEVGARCTAALAKPVLSGALGSASLRLILRGLVERKSRSLEPKKGMSQEMGACHEREL